MDKISIGIQGGRGSFSEEAANAFADKHGINNYEIKYLISSESVLKKLDIKEINYGVFAMENAQGGVVIESVEALARYKCEILDMFYIHVNQNLLARRGVILGDITEIHSHQQALRQCKDYLSENFWTKSLIESDDTAEAARRLGEGKLPSTVGVIGSKSCAELYGLEILADDIHDLKNNITLFLGVKNIL